jgi:predicted ATPase/class 3 adenylate cyclase
LGPIEAFDGDAPVTLSPQLRRLLGLLVVADGMVVSADRLAEYIADGSTDGSTVRTAVSRLRKALDGRVESAEGGYRLAVDAEGLDWWRFEDLRDRSRTAPVEARIGALTSALELWRGPAFGDLAEEEWATASAAKLDAARAAAVEDLAQSLIQVDRAGQAIELLEPHVAEHPYRERPTALLMEALANDGRTADAVRAYERFRVILRDDTGLEPSSELRDLEAQLLGGLDSTRPLAPPDGVLPSGTVTFLFTDIEGSTQRWQSDEVAMSDALAVHDDTLHSIIEQHGGAVFKHTGDGVCAVFTSPSDAVTAAITAQQALELPVRIGIHTGEAELRGRDYFGPSLNRTARVMDAGNGGQILMSAATAGLVSGVATTNLGEHRLKGLADPEQIIQVGTDEYLPLRVARQRKGNLPTELSHFVGRASELDHIADRLAEHRLVTLLGVGGAGKTRLSIETAMALAPTYPDGCWIAELAIIAAPEAVPLAVAAGLEITAPETSDVTDHIISRIRHQRLLLIIDNCEHLLRAVADIVERIIAECPTVTILATSREPLMVNGEQLNPVPSLDPADGVALFLDRAGAEAPQLHLDAAQHIAISELCERLDQLPLAIELATSRLRAMTPVEILDRLDERFRLLVGGRRSRMERHQTMRGTLDWSYALCTPNEQIVFDRLSVFPTGFDLDAARAVATDDDIDELDVLDTIPHLVDRSLLQHATTADGTSRYRMLETMRAYGREHLAERALSDTIRQRHAHHVAATVAALTLHAMGPDEDHVHQRMQTLIPDALVALDWLIDQRDWHRAVRAATVGWPHAYRTLGEMNQRLRGAIVDADGSLDAVAANERMQLLILSSPISGRAFVNDWAEIQRAGMEAVFGRVPLPTDVVFISAFNGVGPPDGAQQIDLTFAHEILSRAENLGDVPLIHRFTALAAAHELLCQVEPASVSIARTDALEELLDQIDSHTARVRFDALRCLQEEYLGNREAAAGLAERALVGTTNNPSTTAYLASCRVLRNRALGGLELTPEQIRRPLTWLSDADFGNRWLAAVTVVHAMDRLGHDDLGDRLLAWVRGDMPEARRFFAASLSTTGLLERFDSVPSHDEDTYDSLAAEVMSVVDEYEQDTRYTGSTHI